MRLVIFAAWLVLLLHVDYMIIGLLPSNIFQTAASKLQNSITSCNHQLHFRKLSLSNNHQTLEISSIFTCQFSNKIISRLTCFVLHSDSVYSLLCSTDLTDLPSCLLSNAKGSWCDYLVDNVRNEMVIRYGDQAARRQSCDWYWPPWNYNMQSIGPEIWLKELNMFMLTCSHQFDCLLYMFMTNFLCSPVQTHLFMFTCSCSHVSAHLFMPTRCCQKRWL